MHPIKSSLPLLISILLTEEYLIDLFYIFYFFDFFILFVIFYLFNIFY